METVLVTGGAGFIGSNFVNRLLLDDNKYHLIILDKLTYAGNLDNFSKELKENPRFEFVKGCITQKRLVRELIQRSDKVIHFAAETHIDRSIVNMRPFITTDFIGTAVLLEEFRKNPKERFVHISTSEVYGSAQKVPIDEDHPLAPQSPYAATKAAADRLAYSYYKTYKLPIVIIRPFNNYGPRQYPEKLIPFFITQALQDKPLYVYGNGMNTRDWLYVEDCCAALQKILEMPLDKIKGQVFNLGSGTEFNVRQIGKIVLESLSKPESLLQYTQDRPGHVERLICETKRTQEILNWQAPTDFFSGLKKTIVWYLENPDWWQKIKARKEYQKFYKNWYQGILKIKNQKSKMAKP